MAASDENSPAVESSAELGRALNDYICGERSFEGLLAAIDRLIVDQVAAPAALQELIKAKCMQAGVEDFVRDSLLDRCHAALDQRAASVARAADEVDLTLERDLTGPDETSVSGARPPMLHHSVLPTSEQLPVAAPREELGPELPHAGTVLNHRFELIRCVGAGGSSNVYKALDRRKLLFDDPFPYVAIKILNKRYRSRPDWPEALRREASRCQQLQFPNIVKVHDVLRDGPVVYIVMEYLSGSPLTQLIRTEDFAGLASEEAIEIINAMGRALAYAHGQSIIHCDFKPANVFITQEQEIKLIDFGIARMMSAEEEPTQTGKPATRNALELFEQQAVTPAYASPELLERGDPDPRDDVYSLACTAYELLTGTHPYDFKPATVARDENLQVQRRRGLTRPQWKALRRALALQRSARTRTIADFLTEFNGVPKIQPVYLQAASIMLVVSGMMWLYTNYQVTDKLRHYVGERLTAVGTQLKGKSPKPSVSVAQKAAGSANGAEPMNPDAGKSEAPFAETRLEPVAVPAPAPAAPESGSAGTGQAGPAQAAVAAAGSTGGAAVDGVDKTASPAREDRQAVDAAATVSTERVAALITQAKTELAADRLVTPAGQSALASYREVLALQPGNAEAAAGLDQVKHRLSQRFTEALAGHDISAARQALQDLRLVAPEDAAVREKFAADLVLAEKQQQQEHAERATRQAEKVRVAAAEHASRKVPAVVTAVRSEEPGGSADAASAANADGRESGLKAIADRLKERALVKQREGALLESQALVAEGLRVQPAHGGLQRLREALDHQLQSQAAQRVDPESLAVKGATRPEPAAEIRGSMVPAKDGNLNFGTF